MSTIVFFLEEPSAREMLKGVLPRVLPPDVETEYIVFQGKQDMEKKLERRLRLWQRPDTRFVVMRDQDSGDCRQIKIRLTELCKASGQQSVLVRIACRELESFYLGDLQAVEAGLGLKGLAKQQNARKYRAPDQLESPSHELKVLSGTRGYRKVEGSRDIGPYLRLDGANTSHSFNVLIEGIRRLVFSTAPQM